MTPGPRFCSRCGAPIEFNAAFCARCGTPQGPPPPVQARPGPAQGGPIPREHQQRHHQGPPQQPVQYGPPPQQYPPQGPPPQQAYGPPPAQPYPQPPAQYGAPPPQGYYGAPPPPQKPAMSGLAIAGTLCAMGAYFSMLIGGMFLIAPCGVSALILGGIGCGIGGALWNSDRQRAKMIISMSAIAIVTTLIIVLMILWMLHVI